MNRRAVLQNILQMSSGRVKLCLLEAASSPGIRNIISGEFFTHDDAAATVGIEESGCESSVYTGH
jgi:hypothetical protein